MRNQLAVISLAVAVMAAGHAHAETSTSNTFGKIGVRPPSAEELRTQAMAKQTEQLTLIATQQAETIKLLQQQVELLKQQQTSASPSALLEEIKSLMVQQNKLLAKFILDSRNGSKPSQSNQGSSFRVR